MLALAMALSLSACDGKDKESENPKPLEYIKIMSFNIRTGTSDRGTANAWDNRKSGVYEMLNSEQPLIVGLQEARKFQRTDILASCPDYAGFGVCRDTGEDVEGDFNQVQESSIFDVCLKTMYNARKKAYSTDSKNTYNAWGASSNRIIDHIFVSMAYFHVHSYRTLNTPYAGVTYISDHYPIYTTLTFK